MEIHQRAPLPAPCLISSVALIRQKGKLFFILNFIASPLAVHPSKPLFVRRNLGILSETLAWVSRWGVSQSVWKGFQRRAAAISSKHRLHVQGLSWPWSQVGRMQQLNSCSPYPNDKHCPWETVGICLKAFYCCLNGAVLNYDSRVPIWTTWISICNNPR